MLRSLQRLFQGDFTVSLSSSSIFDSSDQIIIEDIRLMMSGKPMGA